MVDLFIALVMLFVLVKLQGETSSMVDLFIALVMLFVLVQFWPDNNIFWLDNNQRTVDIII